MASTMSLTIFTILFLSFTLSQASPIVGSQSEADVKAIYQKGLVKHQKTYNGIGDEERRFKIFKDNLKFIDEHNALDHPYKVSLNAFADLTNQEYRAKFLGTRSYPKRRVMNAKNPSLRYTFCAGETLSESVDWRVKGAVNLIKNQGICVNHVPEGQ